MENHENTTMRKLHHSMLAVFRWRALMTNSLLLLGSIAYLICASIWDWLMWPAVAACGVFAVLFVVFVCFWPNLKYKYFAFAVHEEEMEIEEGVWFRKHALIPMAKVQHVETESGPLLRRFGLASTLVVTAASSHRINGLLKKEAEELKSHIGKLARVVDTDE